MMLKRMLDRKLLLMVLSPVMRRIGTALAVYLVSKGAPADTVEQALTALAAFAGIAFDIALAMISDKRKENKVVQRTLYALGLERLDLAPFDSAKG